MYVCPFKPQVITLPAGIKENALKAALTRMAGDAKIIRVRKPYELFGGWDDAVLKISFEVGVGDCVCVCVCVPL